jgi:putative membrane protein insertion efficiency factor
MPSISSVLGTFWQNFVRTMTTWHTGLAAVALWPRRIGRGLILLYRYTILALIGPRCRHLPSCSEYAEEAISRFGLWAGSWMALARILRCNPWGTHGLDFVPAALPAHSHWWTPWRYGRWRGTNETPPR